MIALWITAAALAAGAGALVLGRARRASGGNGAADVTVLAHHRALADIDDLVRRDLLGAEEARATRTEAARRLLKAADAPVLPAARRLSRRALAIWAAGGPLMAVALYLVLGSPRSPDQPYRARVAAWNAAPERATAPELAAVLSALAAARPHDPEPARRLAMLDLSLGDPDGATHALRRALQATPNDPALIAPLAEIRVLKAGGKVDPTARYLFETALAREPTSPTARYYLARADIQQGDTARGLAAWRVLLADLPPGDPRRALLVEDIAAVERTGAPAPAEAQSQETGAVDHAIRGMVEGLDQRLAAHPDDPDGWVRLVRAYAVLGEREKLAATLLRARGRYAAQPAVLAGLDAAARAPAQKAPP